MIVDGLGDDFMLLWLIFVVLFYFDVVRFFGDEIDYLWCEMVVFDYFVC